MPLLSTRFIDGTCARPAEGFDDLEKWKRTDYMDIKFYIKIGEALLYVLSSFQL